MHHATVGSLIASFGVGLAALSNTPRLHAQARFVTDPSPPQLAAPALLSALANYRVVRWASASPVIVCGPGPLTERPATHSELARPRVVPLEEAFADAQSVKRAVAYRMRAIAVERR
jgi:hypothetical protein